MSQTTNQQVDWSSILSNIGKELEVLKTNANTNANVNINTNTSNSIVNNSTLTSDLTSERKSGDDYTEPMLTGEDGVDPNNNVNTNANTNTNINANVNIDYRQKFNEAIKSQMSQHPSNLLSSGLTSLTSPQVKQEAVGTLMSTLTTHATPITTPAIMPVVTTPYQPDMDAITKYAVKDMSGLGKIFMDNKDLYELESRLFFYSPSSGLMTDDITEPMFKQIFIFFCSNPIHFNVKPWVVTLDTYYDDYIRMRKNIKTQHITWQKKEPRENRNWRVDGRPLSIRISLKVEKTLSIMDNGILTIGKDMQKLLNDRRSNVNINVNVNILTGANTSSNTSTANKKLDWELDEFSKIDGRPLSMVEEDQLPILYRMKKTASFEYKDKVATCYFSQIWTGDTEASMLINKPTFSVEVEINPEYIKRVSSDDVLKHLLVRSLELQGLNAPLSLTKL